MAKFIVILSETKNLYPLAHGYRLQILHFVQDDMVEPEAV